MRIGIDARWLSKPNPSGIGVYLTEVLTRLNRRDDGHEYYLFSNKPFVDTIGTGLHFHRVLIPAKIGSLWMLRELAARLPDYHLDVFWGPEHVLPGGLKGVRKVLTIHDIALMIHPSWGKWSNALIQNTLARVSVRRADVIVADSKSTKKDLVTRLRVRPERIRGVYPGRNEPAPFTEEEAREVLCRILHGSDPGHTTGNGSKPYLLYVGTLEPRKNVVSIIRAYERIRQEAEYSNLSLVLAGGLGWKYEGILDAIANSPYREDILRPGYISDMEKSVLLHHAEAFLFPSFYEGFGIPVVEAICAGAPVVTAGNSSLPEAAGPSEFYVDRADDVNAICGEIRKILSMTEEEKKRRNESSRAYVKRFSWERCADRIGKILTEGNGARSSLL